MFRVLFIHGLASSGAYKTASTLRTLLRPCEVLSPDFPIDPDEMRTMLEDIRRDFAPDLAVGLSWGGFWAQKMRGQRKILINPSFHTSALLRTMKGEVAYLSPRADGEETFVVTDAVCEAYAGLEETQFEGITADEAALTYGMFALEDERVRGGDEFESHYPGRAVYYHGTHLPTFPELKKYLVPLVR